MAHPSRHTDLPALTDAEILDIARNTLAKEAEALQQIIAYLDDAFIQSVRLIASCPGKVVITGIGKSAIIAQKIVATFNSTGTPAIFMHAADAIHGDLGMIQPEDVVIMLSKSGESPEIKVLLPLIKNFRTPVIAIVGNMQSSLARQADFVLNTTVSQEACPNNLAPTSSTTAQLAMGDALATALIRLKGFSAEDFAKFHPGGTLGKKLYLRVRDLSVHNAKPSVSPDTSIREVILEMTGGRLGITAVVHQDKLVGVITDGDLRRMMEKYEQFQQLKARDVMTMQPKTIHRDALAVEALQLMRQHNITQVVVLDSNGRYDGIIHLHDLIREGLI
ncbi:KpsF/GutQ family sugar-phosphate isomerase [Thermoflavifilum thermophilum]|uniref:Arabinose-5-phosphate isomerase n=1 Tax=Thermoflavifilum thermophilum TaxID=1393122 RepID=A0A1I7NAI3_9BACT|nr:KpsF/GutQ family sugar-phosphate isomerase [Thermoflavifilum thermophilum]SFV31687.1 arabinose-5-phosphate isomerase [Thermoflavifilum thermophilum]